MKDIALEKRKVEMATVIIKGLLRRSTVMELAYTGRKKPVKKTKKRLGISNLLSRYYLSSALLNDHISPLEDEKREKKLFQ